MVVFIGLGGSFMGLQFLFVLSLHRQYKICQSFTVEERGLNVYICGPFPAVSLQAMTVRQILVIRGMVWQFSITFLLLTISSLMVNGNDARQSKPALIRRQWNHRSKWW